MTEIGTSVAKQIRSQYPGLTTHKEKGEKLAEVMDQLGYNPRNVTKPKGEAVIEVDNYVFYTMAKKDLEICHLDRGLMEAFTDSKVEQNECMAPSGNVCRFKLKPNEDRLKSHSP